MIDEQSRDLKDHMDMKLAPLLKEIIVIEKISARLSYNEKLVWVAIGAIPILLSIMTWALLDYMEFKSKFPEQLQSAVDESLQNYQFESIE